MTSTTVGTSITDFSSRLASIDKKLSKGMDALLPEWWDEELINSPGASQQATLTIAQFLNIDSASVLDRSSELRLKDVNTKYKKASNKDISELSAGTGIIHSVSQTAADITINAYKEIQSPSSIRDSILEIGQPWVSFLDLASYCWQMGVPVLYIPELPVSKKMDALVVNIDGRPVIAITKKQTHDSQLLFLLAHEMGHIFHGHVQNGETLVDKKVNAAENIDKQESEANCFAIELLTGKETTAYHSNGILLSGRKLAKNAISEGQEKKIDPGHIVLNWGYTTGHWAIAQTALKIVSNNQNWKTVINDMIIQNIDDSEANDDQLDYLYKLIKIKD